MPGAGWLIALLLAQPAPASVPALTQEARQAMADGHLPQAEEILRRAITASPRQKDLRFLLGFCLYLENNFGESLRAFEAADQTDARTILYRGLAQEGLGQVGLALESYKRAIALAPRNVEARVVMGRLLRKLGDIVAAEKEIDDTLVLAPDAREVLYEKGQCLFERGAFAAAAAIAERALTAAGPAPGAREIHFLAARAWLKAGDSSMAAKHRAAFESLPMSLVR
ncbi:MAG TPA: tetratricopeptide repeat protein [Bryobacteraceae bacterium]|nr:tetratricopeptide repeat protein [Bryobacteraceae bacterium]